MRRRWRHGRRSLRDLPAIGLTGTIVNVQGRDDLAATETGRVNCDCWRTVAGNYFRLARTDRPAIVQGRSAAVGSVSSKSDHVSFSHAGRSRQVNWIGAGRRRLWRGWPVVQDHTLLAPCVDVDLARPTFTARQRNHNRVQAGLEFQLTILGCGRALRFAVDFQRQAGGSRLNLDDAVSRLLLLFVFSVGG